VSSLKKGSRKEPCAERLPAVSGWSHWDFPET
jgi:hypothetical protein